MCACDNNRDDSNSNSNNNTSNYGFQYLYCHQLSRGIGDVLPETMAVPTRHFLCGRFVVAAPSWSLSAGTATAPVKIVAYNLSPWPRRPARLAAGPRHRDPRPSAFASDGQICLRRQSTVGACRPASPPFSDDRGRARRAGRAGRLCPCPQP